ncbi:unnamed protein product [Penicillium egyptiacum]|uniref:HNH nuclease domain-containing protein n=1 Tax=Penicillium egyptiacum TaxID=1303716 RepID=A0A9W4KRK8_9EURO|nr:unnamed protein product [Penicillium egyptiacum]
MDRVDRYQPRNNDDPTVPVLRAFDTHLPADGRENFLRCLRSLETDQQLHDDAESLINGLLAPMRTLRSSGEPLARESRPSEECLKRDGYKCVITGEFDLSSPNLKVGIRRALTECAHIIPFSLGTWKDEKDRKAKDIIWANLVHMFLSLETINFAQENINDTRNAITLVGELHKCFGYFDFAFEGTKRPNEYKVVSYVPDLGRLADRPKTVTSVCHDPQYGLPSPELLEVHATLARIFHASGGLGEHIDQAFEDLREHHMLATDGSSDISSMLATSSLGVLGSHAGNIE